MTTQTSVRLPVFQRRSASFEETFGVGVTEVLAAIGEAGADPVANAPRVEIDLQSVGYRRSGIVIQIDDPFGSGQLVPCVATVRVGSGVPAARRGLHLSRLGDALARAVTQPYADLGELARALADTVSRTQYGEETRVDVRGRINFLEPASSPPGPAVKQSLETLHLLARARAGGRHGRVRVDAGIRFAHLVACPCVQKVWQYTRAAAAGVPPIDDPSAPGFTHSQRCVTTVLARGLQKALPIPALLRRIDETIVRTMSTLPRGSELATVYRAHRSPQFIEDALREALWAFARVLDGQPFTHLDGRSTSAESIHDFDLSASATLTAEQARRAAAIASIT
jgi:GTP cyclohydrolase FolE2